MESKVIGIGSLVKFTADNTVWRVFFILNGLVRMINVDAGGFDFRDMAVADIVEAKTRGDITIYEDEPYIVDKNALSPDALKTFERNCQFADKVRKLYGPLYTDLKKKVPKQEFMALHKKYGFSKWTGARIIVKWLQSGMQDGGLLDERLKRGTFESPYNYKVKTGRKPRKEQGIILNDYVRAVFDAAMEQYKKSRTMSVTDCFALYVECCFYVENDGKVEKLPPDKRPTERQFRNYIDTHISYKEMREIETSVAEYRNNERLLFGTSRLMAIRPGFLLESDAVEMDMYLVSSLDPTRIVGRAIVYMLADVFSHCIVGASVGFENNSVMGLTNLFINFFVDKNKMLKDANVVINPDLFPSNFLPSEIRCDRGSDFKSDQFEEVCRQLGISRQLCTGATGSMKGLIEQSFRSFHNTYKTEFEHKGYIQKRYDSKHKIEAVCTIDDIKKIVILFIAYHNAKYNKKFKLTKDMLKNGVKKTPIDIWNYGVEKYGAPAPVNEKNLPQLLMNLLPEEIATITREGIVYKNLYYLPFGDKDLKTRLELAKINARKRDKDGKLLNRMQVKVDPRSVNSLFYIKDGNVMSLMLNNQKSGSYIDMTWAEYEEYYDREKDLDAEGEEQNRTLNEQKVKALKDISGSVKKVVKTPSSKDIKTVRKVETQEINNQSAVENFIPVSVPSVEEDKKEEIASQLVDESATPKEETTENKPETRKTPLSSKKAPDFF